MSEIRSTIPPRLVVTNLRNERIFVEQERHDTLSKHQEIITQKHQRKACRTSSLQDKSNCILHPSSFDATHPELEFNVGPNKTLDTNKCLGQHIVNAWRFFAGPGWVKQLTKVSMTKCQPANMMHQKNILRSTLAASSRSSHTFKASYCLCV